MQLCRCHYLIRAPLVDGRACVALASVNSIVHIWGRWDQESRRDALSQLLSSFYTMGLHLLPWAWYTVVQSSEVSCE